MKRRHYFLILVLSSSLVALLTGCNKLLVEKPRAQLTPEFFATPEGIEGGVAAAYSNFRNLWGTENFTNITNGGVDETLAGGSNNNTYLFTYNATLASRTNDFGAMWNIFYQNINSLNGVLEFGPNANMDAAKKANLLGQAKFLRAFCYYHLVTTFGDVPLNLAFITTPTVEASRQPIAEVYTAIIQDLTDAAAELPNTPIAGTGKPAFKATALYLLAKTHLARGWSSAAQGDDFQKAYSISMDLINNRGTYNLGLWSDYGQVNRKGNEYGQETLLVIDHNADPKYGEYTINQFAAGPKENKSSFYFRPNYPTIGVNSPNNPAGASIIDRDLDNGRPFIRIRPNWSYTMQVAFADKVNDYRFDRTFQTHWMANKAATTARGTLVPKVDTAVWMPERTVTADERNRFKGVIFEPSQYTPAFYPSMRKYDDSTRPNINDASTRPFILFKFSELYLIAAEAAIKGGASVNEAASLINTLRQRAAYNPNRSPAENAAAVVAMTIDPADVNLDLILDERTREFYGESLRWWDLVRTQSLIRRVQMYNPEAAAGVQAHHVLRPIPQNQIDLVTKGPEFPQNPGY